MRRRHAADARRACPLRHLERWSPLALHAPPFSCALNPSFAANFPDVWFKFVAPADYVARVSNCETASSISRIEVKAGSCGALVSLNCSTNTCVVVEGPTPFSNEFTSDSGLAMCAVGGSTSDIWFQYAATQDGTLAIDTFGSAFDTVLSVYEGGCATPSLIACNDDAFGLQSEVVIGVVAGTEYQIQVGGYGGQSGMGVLNVQQESSTGIADLVCLGNPNSTGFIGLMSAQGSLFASDNDLTLGISSCPVNVMGMVITTSSSASPIVTIPGLGGGMGDLCIANFQLARFPVISTDASGIATMTIDTGAIPANPTVTMAVAGDTHYFQFWHRDVFNGTATSNLSSAISVTFQ